MNSRFYLRALITGFAFISLPAFLFAAPGNDLCSNATTLTPNTTCSTIRGDLYLASNELISISTCGITNDVWYKFTVPANAISTTITVSMDNGNTAINSNTYIEVFGASLCSSISILTTLGCSSVASGLTLSLTPGSTYYFRVFTTTSTGGNSGKYGFDICVSYTSPPSND